MSGGARVGAGRKRKPAIDKLQAGKAVTVVAYPDAEEQQMPSLPRYMNARQFEGEKLNANKAFQDIWEWLRAVGCASIVSPQLVERYAVCYARWVQCECLISKNGLTGLHPTTSGTTASPYVNIGLNYLKEANRLWTEIYQVVKDNCTTEYRASLSGDSMEQLLTML